MLLRRFEHRWAVTLLELIVVLAIVGALLALLLPAVMSARAASRAAVCKNNLHQLSIAMADFHFSQKRLPDPQKWTVEILPWLEMENLAGAMKSRGTNLEQYDHSRPEIFSCPSQSDVLEAGANVESCHYVLVIHPDVRIKRDAKQIVWMLQDRELGLTSTGVQPWYIGPELDGPQASLMLMNNQGPHSAGKYHVANNQAAVELLPR